MARAFFAAGDAHAEKAQVVHAHFFFAALRVLEPGVAAVDENVSGFEQRRKLRDHAVDRLAGLDHHQHAAGRAKRLDELFERFCAGELFAGILLHEALGPIGFQVPDGDAEAVLFNVEGKILPHNAKSDHSEITHTGLPRSNATFAGRRMWEADPRDTAPGAQFFKTPHLPTAGKYGPPRGLPVNEGTTQVSQPRANLGHPAHSE